MWREKREYLHKVGGTEGELAVGLVAVIRGNFHVASGEGVVLFGGGDGAVHPADHGELLGERGDGLCEKGRVKVLSLR